MADALTDTEIKEELNPDQFEMMFLQTAEGKPPEPVETVVESVVVEPVIEAAIEPAVEVVVEPKVEPPVVEAKVEPVVVKPVTVEPAPPAPVIEYTAEELADLEGVRKDFPEITKVLAAQERLLTEKFGALLQSEVAKVQQTLAPVYANVAQSTQSAFEQAIAAAHADAKTLLPDAEAWIATQPTFLQAAYNQVLDGGTAAQVIEFFTTFKAATGRTADAGTKPEPVVDPEKQRKLASQEGVKSVRSTTKKDNGPLDFETAFNQVA